MKDYKMGGACSRHERQEKCVQNLKSRVVSVHTRDHITYCNMNDKVCPHNVSNDV